MDEKELVSAKDFEEYGSSFMKNLKKILKPEIGAEINFVFIEKGWFINIFSIKARGYCL
jgi:hypothetical protein